MDFLYKTVEKRARTELVIEKSRFIATICPCIDREEVDRFFNEIRTEFKDATHNVPAFILGNKMELKWASDDGEPQGTSGPPILKLLEMKELTNVAVVVTRYFGGIKLGTGGLVRAYSDSAEAAIKEAGVAGAAPYVKLPCKMDYSLYNRLLAQGLPPSLKDVVKLGEAVFLEKVGLDISCPLNLEGSLRGLLMEMSNGGIEIEKGSEIILPVSLTSNS